MSAPRKIWADKASMGWVEAYPGQQMNPCEEVYHHDDVVRELVEALERVSENMAKMATGQTSLIDSTKRTADAALAKIAQEG